MSIFSFENSFADTLPETHCLFSLSTLEKYTSPNVPRTRHFASLPLVGNMYKIVCVYFFLFQINKNDRNNFFNELAMIASIGAMLKRTISQNTIACMCILRSTSFVFNISLTQLHCGKMC